MLNTLDMRLFGGRTDRAGFWGAFFVLLVAFMIAATVFGASIDPKNIVVTAKESLPPALIGLLGLVTFIRAAGRRLHDIGQSGFVALAVIPFVDIVTRASVGSDLLTLTLNPLIVLMHYATGVTDWPPPIEWLRNLLSFNISLGGSTVRLYGLIFPVVLVLGLVKGQSGANTYGEGSEPEEKAPMASATPDSAPPVTPGG